MRGQGEIFYEHETAAGPVRLMPEENDRWAVVFREHHLGSYHSSAAAADDAGGGHTFTPPGGADFRELGVPRDLWKWTKRRMG